MSARATCARCTAPAAGIVSVAALDDDRARLAPVAEVALCAEHLADVAAALGFERPADVRAPRALVVGGAR